MTIKEKLKAGKSLTFSDMRRCYKEYSIGSITLDQYKAIISKHNKNKRNEN